MTETTPVQHVKPRKSFIVMMACMISLVALSIDAMLPAMSKMAEDLQISNANDIQFVISALFVGLCCGQVFAGPLSDAYGRRTVLFLGLTLYSIGSLVCLFAPSLEVMLAGRFIQGLGASGSFITVVSVVRDQYHGRGMASVMSLIMMIFIMIPAIAPALGQALTWLGSWHYIFAFFFFYALTIMTWTFLKLEETHKKENRTPFTLHNILHAIKVILTTKLTVLCILAIGCTSGMLIATLSSIQQIYSDYYDQEDLFVLIFGISALASGTASLINSRFVEQYGMRFMAIRSFGLLATLSLAFVTAQILLPNGAPFALFVLYGVGFMFCLGLLFGNLNALAMEPMGKMAGIASALIASMSQIFGITYGVIIGQMYDGTPLPMTTGILVLSSCGMTIVAILKRYHEPRDAKKKG